MSDSIAPVIGSLTRLRSIAAQTVKQFTNFHATDGCSKSQFSLKGKVGRRLLSSA